MFSTRQTILASRPAALVLAISLVTGLSAPFVLLPRVHAESITPDGTVELSAAPVDQTKSVPPNIAVTLDDSGSMSSTRMGDTPPYETTKDWSDGPWRCANVIDPDHPTATDKAMRALAMNGVYYNPNIVYVPPVQANPASTPFPDADATLTAVWVDGIAVNRPRGAVGVGAPNYYNNPDLDQPSAGSRTNLMSTASNTRWKCGTYGSGAYGTGGLGGDWWSGASPMDGQTHTLSDGTSVQYPLGGPYYYRLKLNVDVPLDTYGRPTNTGCSSANCDGVHTLYNAANWEAVPVPQSQYQNFADWYAYYRTRNQMARTTLSRVFGSPLLAARTNDGGYGADIRVAWQNINSSTYDLPSNAIISALIDTSDCTSGAAANPSSIQQSGATNTPPDCYRSAFFNWIFQVGAGSSTPLRGTLKRAGDFFKRGASGGNGTLEDPYWQPPQQGAYDADSNPGNELYCRQNYSLILTDGLWNTPYNGGTVSSLGSDAQPIAGATLPDGVSFPDPAVAGVGSIYAPQHDAQYPSYVSLSDLAYAYWATNLRPDLYQGGPTHPDANHIVTPYLPDTRLGLFPGAGDVTVPFVVSTNPDGTPNYDLPAEEYFNPKNDPATWPHMTSYNVGLGVSGVLNFSENTDCTEGDPVDQDACALRKGEANSSGSVGWPQPESNGNFGVTANIDDTWHAALAGRGQFFSAGSPQDLIDQLSSILSSIQARASAATPSAVNASVATVGALSFNTGFNADWSGVFQAVILNSDGTVGATPLWDAGSDLDAATPSGRNIYTDTYSTPAGCGTGNYTFAAGTAFTGTTAFDCVETAGLETPALAPTPAPPATPVDTLPNRVAYLRGDRSHETDGTYRARGHVLGAIIHSQPVYVSFPNAGYVNSWPAGAPEIQSGAQSYGVFVTAHADRAGTVYVGANDGMLHAFAAPAPVCTSMSSCDYGNGGTERWAFVPRAVYANLGNLTNANDFQFLATVDATPVTRDVFFSGDQKWHTILAGGVGVGGRGVYALDITDPTAFSASDVLWEFDSDMTPSSDCTARMGSSNDTGIGCRATDLGYTVSQPNIGRLADGKWVVIVPNGYFPDCAPGKSLPTADAASCQTVAAQAPKDSANKPYSALFVLDAQTGDMIAELKTPTDITGVTSFGLATPVMGDYEGDQIDDVAFAGDLQGNLWRFDLSGTSASTWTVTLVYKGVADADDNQGLQPITTMPRLFPDPSTNRFMVVFGTGRYLGAADNGTTTTQAVMGVRDVMGDTFSQTDLTRDYLQETNQTQPDGSIATLRCVTGTADGTCGSSSTSPPNPVPASGQPHGGGWVINLQVDASDGTQLNQGERVVVSPGAIFASNTAVFETLLTGSLGNDPCNPATQGAVMALNALTGGPAGVSSLGGGNIVGGRVSNVRTSGSLPIVSALGGGQAYLPGVMLAPAGTKPVAVDTPMWRRRSWNEINENQ